jgi:hypothetical protein
MRGVQIVVLKGQPCDPRTYDILTCVSFANQNDVYVTLKALQENEEYLVNVDGYLHDYCTFQIEVSENAKGLPIAPSQAMDTNSSQHDNLIRIEWNLEDSLKNVIAGFRIFLSRDEAAKSTLYAEIPLEVNAHGDFRKTYWFEDSILPSMRMVIFGKPIGSKIQSCQNPLIDTHSLHQILRENWIGSKPSCFDIILHEKA